MERSATPLVAEITDRLVTAIAAGEFLPGSRLPAERDLATLLGVGRTSVRAALAELHERGLIATARGRSGGSFVQAQWTDGTAPSVLHVLGEHWGEIADRLEAARRVAGAIARAAAERRDDADVAVLEERLAAYRAAGTAREAQVADAALHEAIADAARVGALKTLLLELEAATSVGTPVHLWGRPDGIEPSGPGAQRDHGPLVAAIRERRPADAEAIALEHGRIDLEQLEATRRRAEQQHPS